ncbi:MAG: hypothetical protein AYK18_17245 [Theionarchaea archaeon DG-70]|nr:MAG: hypothetical protein AYK18_17245 [Theionarchaea archaeon DG-70]
MKISDFANYTTKIPVEKTIAEIEALLARNGATDIYKQYETGNCIGIKFAVMTDKGKVAFKLPLNVEGVFQVIQNLKAQGKLRKLSKREASNINTARRIGWRLLKDYIRAAVPLLQSETVTIQQLFLPYVYDPSSDKTLYQLFEEQGLSLLTETTRESKEQEGIL